jgi:hypothetical protein
VTTGSSGSFYNVNVENVTLHVPCGKKANYNKDLGSLSWKETIDDVLLTGATGGCIWMLSCDSSTLTVSGSGAMGDYSYGAAPWWSYKDVIKAVAIKDGVTSIGAYAFAETGLTSVAIGDSVKTIGNSAFFGCPGLTSVAIGEKVEAIELLAFGACSSLTSITVDSKNASYSSGNDGVLFNEDKTTLIQYPAGKPETGYSIPASVDTIGDGAFLLCKSLASVAIPSSVKAIGNRAFQACSDLDTVAIGEKVEAIGEFAFSDCLSLDTVAIPKSVTAIGRGAFYGCIDLTSIEVDDNNTSYSSVNGVLFNGDTTTLIQYPIGKTESSYTIPASVDTIGFAAFAYCNNLDSVAIPSSVKAIENRAFQACSGLTEIYVKATTPPNVGIDAFESVPNTIPVHVPCRTASDYQSATGWSYFGNYNEDVPLTGTTGSCTWTFTCDGVLTISGTGKMADYTNNDDQPWRNYKDNIKAIIIGDNVTAIGNYAFYRCHNSDTVAIGSSVTSIGIGAFAYDTTLKTVTIGKKVETIGLGAFGECSSLTSFTVDDENTSYSSEHGILFNEDKTTLILYPAGKPETGYSIPASVDTIGDGAFLLCKSLASVAIPNSVTTFGHYAFYGCSKLDTVTIGSSVTSIGIYAFSYDANLKTVAIGEKVKTIGTHAFSDCSGLTEIYVKATTPPNVEIDAFNGVPTTIPVHVPCGTASDYQSATGWNAFTNITGDVIPVVTVLSNDNTNTMGTVYITKPNTCDDNTATFEANPNTGYRFVQWNDGNMDSLRTVTVTQDTTFTATFAEVPYGISLSEEGTHTFPDTIYGYGMQAPLTVTVTNTGNNPTGELAVTVNHSEFALSANNINSIGKGSTGSFTITPNTRLSAGEHTATVTVSNNNNNNNNTTASLNVSFTVNPAPLTITPKAGQSKVYGTTTDPTLAFTVDGWQNNDKNDSATIISGALSRELGDTVRTYAIKQGTLLAGNNYTVYVVPSETFAITKKDIEITGGDIATKTYDKTTTATPTGVSFSGLLSGESLAIDEDYEVTNATFNNADAGVNKTVQMTVTLKNTPTANNYNLTNGVNYQLTGQSIGAATLTITPNAGQSKVYGTTTDPTLAFTVSGWQNGDKKDSATIITGALSRVAGEGAGMYEIEQGNLSAGSSYTVNVTPNVKFTITPATLTITPNAGQTKVYGAADPTLMFTVDGWQNGDKNDSATIITGALSRVEGEGAGTYEIEQGDLSAGDNYSIHFIYGVKFEITTSGSTSVPGIEVTGATSNEDGVYVVDYPTTETITIAGSNGAKVICEGHEEYPIQVNVIRGGTQEVRCTVVWQNGSQEEHTLMVEKRLDFDIYVLTSVENVLGYNKRLLATEGYNVTGVRWYGDTVLLAENLYYALREEWSTFDPNVEYYFVLETPDGEIRSTGKRFDVTTDVAATKDNSGGRRLTTYPNPLPSGATLTVHAGEERERVRELLIYNAAGDLVLRQSFSGASVTLPFAAPAGIYFLRVGSRYGKIAVK